MKTVFLDRDGVINKNRIDHVKSWEEFVFLPGALDALRRLRVAGWRVLVVTNQAIIHRHIVAQSDVEDINQRMALAVQAAGGSIDAILYCPHRQDENCACRKPRPGLLFQAADMFGLRLNECYLVGDAFTDIAAGQTVGCATALVQTGRGRQQLAGPLAADYHNYYIARDLATVVPWLIWTERRRVLRQSWLLRWPASLPPRVTFPRLWSINSNST